ncbi:nucleoside triphosphate pyrophosphatase [Caldicellulosiruptoraceae bacterium PP1]
MKKLVLASASPRRISLLKQFKIKFEVIPSDIDEVFDESLSPDMVVKKLAKEKVLDVSKKINFNDVIIIGADTIVYIDNKILGKPKDKNEAFEMLKMISGKEHIVYTGMCLYDTEKDKIIEDFEATKVYISHLSDEEIIKYIETGEPLDKAGAYAIQGYGSLIVKSINGCYFNVVGLPLYKLNKLLNVFNIKLL